MKVQGSSIKELTEHGNMVMVKKLSKRGTLHNPNAYDDHDEEIAGKFFIFFFYIYTVRYVSAFKIGKLCFM